MVTAAVTDGMLRVTVENAGTLRKTHREDAMGLELMRRRLEALGAGPSFSLRQAGTMVRAKLRISRARA